MYAPAPRRRWIGGRRGRSLRLQPGDLPHEELPDVGVFVAEVDIDLLGLDSPCGDEHPFEETVGVGLQVDTVLERAGLALVGVDGHQAGLRALPDHLPLLRRAEPRPAEPAEAGGLDRRDHVVGVATAGEAVGEAPIPPLRDDSTSNGLVGRTGPGRPASTAGHRFDRGLIHGPWPTSAAGACSHRPTQGERTTRTPGPSRGQLIAEPIGPPQEAGHAVADADRQRRGGRARRRGGCRSGRRTWRPRRPRPSPAASPRPGPRGRASEIA